MKQIKNFLKKFYILRLLNLYKHQWILKTLYSTDEKKEKYIKKKFKENVGYEIDFSKEPETFNEKIQFRKLYDKNPLYSICADKYRVREYVKEKIGEEYLIPLYLVTDKLTEEQWDKLPNSFVAKANHNSGPVQIVKDKNKVNKKEIIKELNLQLKVDYGILSMEKYYSDIPRKIIVEKFLKTEGPLNDYKIHCFKDKLGNRNIFIEHILDSNDLGKLTSCFYSATWEKIGLSLNGIDYNKKIEKPKNLEKMIKIANKLSEDFGYVRVDLYNLDGKIYFGELTFCNWSGFGKFSNEEWNSKFGNYWYQQKLK